MPDPQPKRQVLCRDCGKPFLAGPFARWGPCCRWKRQGRWRGHLKKYQWTPERDQVLRERYDGRIAGRAAAIGASLGWPAWVIKKRATTLGLTHPAQRRDWTATEETFLLEHVGSRLTPWIAKQLRRTETSVVLKLKRMKISRRFRDGYTLSELELCFGVDHHSIDRWIREGKLVGRRRGTRRSAAGGRPLEGGAGPADAWYFTDEDLLRFVREHPTAFRLDKVDQVWFMDLITSGGLIRRALQDLEETA